jgi:hypothetical protein
MATNLHIDDRLVEKAVELGRHKSKREAVTHALEDYVRRLEQLKIIDAFGTFDFDPDYDYKKQRQRK